MPFSVSERAGILTLELDTPRSTVNILDRPTARQLLGILDSDDAKRARALVLRSKKPNSFMNGVGLMLSHSLHGYDDGVRVSQELRDAFVAVRAARVPTIAAVQGTCWGCGVEFLLNTQYRLAADTVDTQFYMTELRDYLFIPLFRSTKNLPETVGLADAIDLLLWGEPWDVRKAAARGLINAHAPAEGFDAAVDAFVDRVLAGDVASCLRTRAPWDDAAAAAERRARARIAELPAAHHPVYLDALQLLVDAARAPAGEEHRLREIRKCIESATCELGKAAHAFFYIRQMAAQMAAGPMPARAQIVARGAGDFAAELERRTLPGVTVTRAAGEPLVSVRSDDSECAAIPLVGFHAAAPTAPLVLYRPLANARYVELQEPERGRGRLLASYLARAGFSVALSRSAARPASNGILFGFFRPILAALVDGSAPNAIEAALRQLGFARRASAVAAALDESALVAAIAPELPRPASAAELARVWRALVDDTGPCAAAQPLAGLDAALAISLCDAAVRGVEPIAFGHPTFVDLAARELLEFPLGHTSLCTWLTRDRVRAALARGSTLVGEAQIASATTFAGRRRGFYG